MCVCVCVYDGEAPALEILGMWSAIVLSSTQARSSSTRKGPIYGSNRTNLLRKQMPAVK